MSVLANVSVHRARVNGIELFYRRAGNGEAVVLLHGCPQTSYAWRQVMPLLAEQYTVIAPDLRGLGNSERPAAGYDKATVGEDIATLVRELGFSRIFLVGHDIGATVAYACASAHPQLVRGLAMLESGPIFDPALLDFSKGVGLWHVPFHMAPDIPELLVTGRERAYLEQFFRLAYDPGAITSADIDEYLRAYVSPGGLRAYFAYYRALPQDNDRVAASTLLTTPVLALGGETSLGAMVEASMHRVAGRVQGDILERCGHWMPEERPAELAARLLTFFSEVAADNNSS